MNIRLLFTAFFTLLVLICSVATATTPPITEDFITPTRIMRTAGQVSSPEILLKPFCGQVAVSDSQFTVMRTTKDDTASVLLDFGNEIHGGLKIYAGTRQSKAPARFLITYGESVTEAMSKIERDAATSNPTNDHATRQLVAYVPWLGSVTTGYTGFRFARIDLLDSDIDVKLNAVQAVSRQRQFAGAGTFSCNDTRLNSIWQTSVRTLRLNMQEYIWDGIKRDRLVWLGDLNPEILVACNVLGPESYDLIHKSLDFGKNGYPLPKFINDMSSYSLWWIINQHDLYLYEGNTDYLTMQLPYVNGLVDLYATLIDPATGEEKIPGGFLDWPTSRLKDVIHAGMQSLAVIAMDNAEAIGKWTGDAALASKAAALARLLRKHTPNNLGNTQALSLAILSGQSKSPQADAKTIIANGLEQYSTFYGYYAGEALARQGFIAEAMENISHYWGAMLDLGATSFWEDFTYADLAKSSPITEFTPQGGYDIHADGGDYCYKGLRLSLCHGWAAGPAAWLTNHVLGVTPAEPGFKAVRFKPCLGPLEWASGTIPTPLGKIKVSLKRLPDGRTDSVIQVPQGVKIVD